jgi:hypothetical protein
MEEKGNRSPLSVNIVPVIFCATIFSKRKRERRKNNTRIKKF